MKNLSKKLFASIFALSMVSFSVQANEIENFEVSILENSTVVKLEVNTPTLNSIDVTLYNGFEREILRERVEVGETFESQIDFSQLRRGTYTLVSEVGNMSLNKVLRVNGDQVKLIDSYYSFKPLFKQEGNLLTVYYVKGAEKAVSLSIEDNLNIYYDEFYSSDETVFTKVFSLENLSSGTYNFNFTANGETFLHEFEVD